MSITNYGGIYNFGSGGGSGGGTIGNGNVILITLDATSGALDYNLPAIKFKPNYVAIEYNIIKIDSSSNPITIKVPIGTTFKNGTTSISYTTNNQNETIRIIPDSATSYRRI